jgi:hypothetical protein
VDSNLRQPALHRILNLPDSHGLSDAILQPPPVGDYLQATEVEKLWLLTSGHCCPIRPNC